MDTTLQSVELREVDLQEEVAVAGPGSPISPPPIKRSHSGASGGTKLSTSAPQLYGDYFEEHDGREESVCSAICSMGGGGWFSEALDISISVDTEHHLKDTSTLSLVPPTAFRRWLPLVDASQLVKGTVTVHASPGRHVWMQGLTATLEEHLALSDAAGSILLGAATVHVASAQYVTGEASFPFMFTLDDLARAGGNAGLREGYVGDMLAVRHLLCVSAARPWYTPNIVHTIPIGVQRVETAPPPDTPVGPVNEEGGPNTVMVIPDCNGRAEFVFDRDALTLDGVLEGTVVFTEVTRPIVGAHVMLIRTEVLAGSMFETVVGEHTVLGPAEPDGLATRPIPKHGAEGLLGDDDFIASPFVEFRHPAAHVSHQDGCPLRPVVGSAELHVTLPLADLPLSPTMAFVGMEVNGKEGGVPPADDDDTAVGVRYFLRLVLEGEAPVGGEGEPAPAYWNTHELFLHRSRLHPDDPEEVPPHSVEASAHPLKVYSHADESQSDTDHSSDPSDEPAESSNFNSEVAHTFALKGAGKARPAVQARGGVALHAGA